MSAMVGRRELITLLGGAAAAWPLAARAKQTNMLVVGFLSGSSLAERRPVLTGFRQALAEAGYVEGQNLAIEYRWVEGQYDRLPALAADLVRRQVTVLVAGDGCSRRPMLINPTNANAERDAATVQDAARAIGVQILVTRAAAESDFEAVFATLRREQAGALLVNSDVFFTSRRDQIVALAGRHSLPVMSAWREFPLAGGLISYGPSLSAAFRQIGLYTAKILKGAKPADLPVVQPTAFELVINLKTAKSLGLDVPLHLQQLADEVIEWAGRDGGVTMKLARRTFLRLAVGVIALPAVSHINISDPPHHDRRTVRGGRAAR
jgi:ABC-type uncharacterized transport system substrate-binding protein